jgi:hypothetical protein
VSIAPVLGPSPCAGKVLIYTLGGKLDAEEGMRADLGADRMPDVLTRSREQLRRDAREFTISRCDRGISTSFFTFLVVSPCTLLMFLPNS